MSSRDFVSVYRRRPKYPTSDKQMEDEPAADETTAHAPTAKNRTTRNDRASCINRSISSRGNVNTLSTYRQPSDKAKQAFASPNVYRKKRVEAPADFVHEQKSYFKQVDAFELEEESPLSKDRWMPEPQQKDTVAPCMQLYSRGLLQAVQEDAPEDLPNANSKSSLFLPKDPLSHILRTPQSIQSLQKSKSRGPTQNSLDAMVQKDLHGRRPVTGEQQSHCKAPVVLKKPYPIIVLSDDDNENFKAHRPESFSQSRHRSRQQELAAAGTGQTVLHVIDLDDSPVPLSRDCNTKLKSAHVKCEYSKGLSTCKKGSTNINHSQKTIKELAIICVDDSPVPLSRDYNTKFQSPPVKCEYSECLTSSKKVPTNIHHSQKAVKEVATELLATRSQKVHYYHQAEEGLVEQIKKLEFQASKDEDHLEFTKLNDDCASKEQLPIRNIHSPSKAKQLPIFEAVLKKCGQTAALPLEEAIMQLSDIRDVVKLGEGTYGEAFRAGNFVFKIVPMDGSFLVNGEPQKTLAEMHTEMLLMLTLNRFRKENSTDFSQHNICNNFIETKMVKVCKGFYGEALIKAWEEWGIRNESENDHPKIFLENQLYMLFVLADGGKDLESISINSFEVARSILIQVTAGLAIAEEDCEFEHRDLHWGNILVAQTTSDELYYKLDGTDLLLRTCGVLVQIIDFTLSRLFTGKEVLFSDLSVDPLLFGGPKGDIQADVYRKMLHLTKGRWDKRFLKTNCYWIHYLVEILLTRKKFPCTHHESRALRALKKRVMSYDSARACLRDEFFASELKEGR